MADKPQRPSLFDLKDELREKTEEIFLIEYAISKLQARRATMRKDASKLVLAIDIQLDHEEDKKHLEEGGEILSAPDTIPEIRTLNRVLRKR
jgi:hypothetical protein